MDQHNNINRNSKCSHKRRKFRRLVKFSSIDDSDNDIYTINKSKKKVLTIHYKRKEEKLLPISEHLAYITKKLTVKRYDYSKPSLDDDEIEDVEPDTSKSNQSKQIQDIINLSSNNKHT